MKNIPCLLVLTLLFVPRTAKADNYPRNYAVDMVHYAFELTLSDQTDTIAGRTTLTVLFRTGDTKHLRLDLINRTAARGGKGMVVEQVLFENAPVSFRHEQDALFILLPRSPDKNTTASFVVRYKGIPADGLRIGPTRYGDRSFFNENWPNRTRHWLPTVDHPYDKATNEFIVTAPAHYQVVSNGSLIEESVLDKDRKRTHWKQSAPIASWLYVLGVAEFAVQQVDRFDGKPIQTWVYPRDREAGFHDFAAPTREVLAFYTAYVGPFAYEKLANIQSPSVGGGMETASAIFYGENLVNGKCDVRLRNVVIHEIAHQWFGNAVTESTWDDAWLSEGFATFFTLLFQEYAYGHAEYIADLKKARKRIFDFYRKDPTYKVIDDRTAEEGPVTNDMTYQKGAWFLHMLREKMGHEAFREGIRSYYRTYFNANASTDDLIKEMQRFTDVPLRPFFHQWLNRSDVLSISGSWHYDTTAAQVVIRLEQVQPSDLVFDVPVEVHLLEPGADAPRLLSFKMDTRTAVFKVASSVKPLALVPDPRTVLLAGFELRNL